MRFLNHGAFGATPVELQEEQTRWRRRIEANPPRFFLESCRF
jgi:isopenicillin-N epimerase